MKYLELECISKITGDLLQIEESMPGVAMRLEAYSLKKTRVEKESSHSGKYKSISAMVSAGLNLVFFGYEMDLMQDDLQVITEEEYKSMLISKMFTLGITKDYLEMSRWVDGLFKIIKEAAGEERILLRLNKRAGPFEKCNWSECVSVYGKVLKRMIIFTILYRSYADSPTM